MIILSIRYEGDQKVLGPTMKGLKNCFNILSIHQILVSGSGLELLSISLYMLIVSFPV